VAARFRALSEPARLKILNALMGGPATMGALVAATGLEQSNLSRHVAALERAHCVRREPRGREVLVTVADPDLHALCALVCRRLPPR
jgi:DNA-binding transcriptional ArsR family regulator